MDRITTFSLFFQLLVIIMGAGGNTKQIVCSKTAELLKNEKSKAEVNVELLQTEDSTLPVKEAKELVDKCNTLKSHDEELKAYKEVGSHVSVMNSEIGTDPDYKFTFVWFNTIGFILLHIIGFSGALAAVLGYCRVYTSLYCKIKHFNTFTLYLILLSLTALWLVYVAGQGVTMGAHRLWSHRAFKAKRWLKIILLYMHTLAGQNCLWVWVRDHRQHHKFR